MSEAASAVRLEKVAAQPEVPPVEKKSSRRSWVLGVIGLVVLLGAATVARHWWTVGRFVRSTDDAYVGGDVTVVAPKVAGFIASVEVTDNQPVKAGDLLVKLDARDLEAALARADAAVAAQRAALEHLEATRQLQGALIAQASATIDAADAEEVRTRDDQKRYANLVAASAIAPERSQRADAEFREAQAGTVRARAQHRAATQQLNVIASERDQAKAALAGALAERDAAALNLSYTELRAPIDGVVGNRSARQGAYAPVGAQLLAIVPASGLWVDANFKESELAHLHAGLPASIEADVLPGETFHGHVISIAPATGAQFSVLPPENATGNFTKIVQRVPVRIALDGDAALLGRLRPGLSVVAAVDERGGASEERGISTSAR